MHLKHKPGLRLFAPAPRASRANTAREWDDYWTGGSASSPGWYDVIARFYRYRIIQPSLIRFVMATFPRGSRLLHAGCGSGEVDGRVLAYAKVTALDVSQAALDRYKSHHCDQAGMLYGSILDIPAPNDSFDGVYNLGVLEHFPADDIVRALSEFRRVLKPGGKVLLFWPPRYGLSVQAIRVLHFILNRIMRRNVRLHPDEPSLVRSRADAKQYLERAGLELVDYAFGPRDLFTYAVITGVKTGARRRPGVLIHAVAPSRHPHRPGFDDVGRQASRVGRSADKHERRRRR